jgi:hypothetical protein
MRRDWSEQTRWGQALMTATLDVCSGWLNWAYAGAVSPNADLSATSGLWTENGEIKEWGLAFSTQAHAVAQKPPLYTPAKVYWSLDGYEHLYRVGGYPPLDWLAGQLESQPGDSVEVAFS